MWSDRPSITSPCSLCRYDLRRIVRRLMRRLSETTRRPSSTLLARSTPSRAKPSERTRSCWSASRGSWMRTLSRTSNSAPISEPARKRNTPVRSGCRPRPNGSFRDPLQNPFTAYAARARDACFRARRLTDVVDPAAYRRTALGQLISQFGHTIQMRMPGDSGTIWVFEVSRNGRNFTTTDLDVLDAVRPWFMASRRSSSARSHRGEAHCRGRGRDCGGPASQSARTK